MKTEVNICGIKFKNPVVTASGTYGFGDEYGQFYDISRLGAVCVKGLTLAKRDGNIPPRIAETPSGILNSVGLQNPGVDAFISDYLPRLIDKGATVIANISGNSIEDYCEMAKRLAGTKTHMLEMNISCPNVKQGGMAFGTNPDTVYEITKEVKKYAAQPLIVKLSPNVTDITQTAKAAEAGGADAISLINTLTGMKIDINTRKPILYNNIGGLSGPAVKPVAVRMVWQCRNAVSIPIIGMGGIASGEDAIEFMLAGANAVAVGTYNFVNPNACIDVINGIEDYMKKHNIDDINDIVGKVILNG
ncbi:MAG: dihydroorotate dehydrogenase [Clostridia bacterium]|nr:dihydroorotate dehydrogenase [Clostridia bacterium]